MSDGDEPLDYLRMARVVVRSRFRLPEHLVEDATAEAVLAGWKASNRHDPDADSAMRLKGWVWVAMHHGVQDFLRERFGRKGERAFINAPLSLDMPAMPDDPEGARLHEIIRDPQGERAFEVIEARETLFQLVAGARLTANEQHVILGTLHGRTLLEMAGDLGVSEGRTCQIRLGAYAKMRAVDYAA